MQNLQPPTVDLIKPPYTSIRILRRGRSNIVAAIPRESLVCDYLSGRSLWRWHSLTAPEQIQQVLSGNVRNYPKAAIVHRILRPAVAGSLMLANKHDYLWQRQTMQPAFGRTAICRMTPVVRAIAAKHAEELANEKRFRLDASDYVTRVAFSVICRVADSTGKHLKVEGMRTAVENYIDKLARATLLDLLALPPRITLALHPKKRSLTKRVLDQAEAAIELRMKDGPPDEYDLLQRLIDAVDPDTGYPMTRSRVRANLLFAIVAGFESSAAAMGWAMWMLAIHPELQERARSEAVAAGSDRKMPVLTSILLETMRLYPPVPLLIRQAVKADRIQGHSVRSGDFVFVPIYATHRHRKFWKNPDSFDPSRFAGGKICPVSEGYMPFSTGPRGCPGASFSMMEMREILADFLCRFRFFPSPGKAAPSPKAILVLKPHGGVWLDVERL